MKEHEIEDMKDSITRQGLLYPIVLHRDGRIIDGRNRYIACKSLGIDPPSKVYEGTDEGIIDYCISANNHRRQLAVHEASEVAAKLANIRRGDQRPRQRSDTSIDVPGNCERLITEADAAKRMGVSVTSLQRTKKIISGDAVPEIVQMFRGGDLSIAAAATLAELPNEEQRDIAAKGPAAATRAASELKKMAVVRSRTVKQEGGEFAQQYGKKISLVIELIQKVHKASCVPDYQFCFISMRELTASLLAASEAAFPRKKE